MILPPLIPLLTYISRPFNDSRILAINEVDQAAKATTIEEDARVIFQQLVSLHLVLGHILPNNVVFAELYIKSDIAVF
jgi:hypothetical protein